MSLAFQNMLLPSMVWIKKWSVTELVRKDLKAHLMRSWKWWQPRKISYILSCMICTTSLHWRHHLIAQSKIPLILTSHFFSAKRNTKQDITVYSEAKLVHNINYLFANCYFSSPNQSSHGRPDRKSQPFSRRYLQSPESDLAILSSYVDSTKSSRTLDSSDMRLQTNKELLNVGCYDWQVNYNNAEIVDQFSPSNDAVANMCHLTPLSDPPLTSMSSSTSSKTTGWINISQVQPSPGTGYVSSGGSLHWRSSPITPMARLDGTKSVQGLDPDGGLCEILEDETPEILKDSATPIKPVKVSSPNQKRVSPPKSHLHELESSSSGGLRSGRKFILKAVPSFPPLTPCIDSKGGTNLKAINFQDNNSSKWGTCLEIFGESSFFHLPFLIWFLSCITNLYANLFLFLPSAYINRACAVGLFTWS